MTTRMITVLLLAALAGGCSRHASDAMQPATALLRVTPGDGATSVRLDAAVTLDFGTVVDRSIVEQGVHLIGEPDMFTNCPDLSMGNHGTMNTVMGDPRMLQHMDTFHSAKGSFTWNDAGTTCTFGPDSLMRPQTRYMVHMSGGMVEMMQQMGGSMMGGQMNKGGDMMVHFQTMSGDGHAGHH